MSSIRSILQDGDIYLALYAYLALAMIVEVLYENAAFSRWMARVGMVAIVVLIGLRWDTGTDWLAYYRVFYTTDSSSDYDSVVFGIDQGYVLFNRLMFFISDDYSVFLMADAAIAVGAVYLFIERSTRLPNMGVYLFYTSYVVTHFMGSNRRMLAIGFVCLAFLFLSRERRLSAGWPRWAVPFAAAGLIHRTSLAALPGLLVSRRAWPACAVILGLLACLALGIAGLPFNALEWLGNTLSQYTGISAIDKLVFYTSGDADLDANVNIAMQAALGVAKRGSVLLIFIAYMRFGSPSQYAQRLYNIYIVGCAIYFAMVGSPIFQIISTYYSIVEIVLIPIIFSTLPRFKTPYVLYLLTFPLLLLVSSLIPYMELYIPYRSIFRFTRGRENVAMRIAITGASGFIGSHLLPALATAGVDVVAVSRRDTVAADWRRSPVLDRDSDPHDWARVFEGVDVVIHAARGRTSCATMRKIHSIPSAA